MSMVDIACWWEIGAIGFDRLRNCGCTWWGENGKLDRNVNEMRKDKVSQFKGDCAVPTIFSQFFLFSIKPSQTQPKPPKKHAHAAQIGSQQTLKEENIACSDTVKASEFTSETHTKWSKQTNKQTRMIV